MWLEILADAAFAFHFSIDPGWGEVIKTGFMFPLGAKVTEVLLGILREQCQCFPMQVISLLFSQLGSPNILPAGDGFSSQVSWCGQQNCLFLLALDGGLERTWCGRCGWIKTWPCISHSLCMVGWDACIALLGSSGYEKRGIIVLWWTQGRASSLSCIESIFLKPKSAIQPQLELC